MMKTCIRKRLFGIISAIIALNMLLCTMPVFAQNNIDAFSVIFASDYDKEDCNLSSSFSIYNGMTQSTGTGNYISFKNINFSKKVAYLEIYISTNQECVMQLRADRYDGDLLCEFTPEISGDYGITLKTTIDLNTDIEGIHDLYLLWKSGSSNFKQMQFRPFLEDASGYVATDGWDSYLSYSDIEDSKYRSEITLLKQLGFLDFIDGNQFGAAQSVTKADFTKSVFKIYSEDIIKVGDSTFKDVPNQHSAHMPIEFLSSNGMLPDKGDMFYPQNSLTAGYFAQFIVKILGGQNRQSSDINTCFSTAKQMGAFNDVNVNVSSELTREQYVKILHNVLNADYDDIEFYSYNSGRYIKVKGILSKYRKIFNIRGTVTAIPSTGLDTSQSGVGLNSVKINDESYKLGSQVALQLLGYYCDCYYSEESDGKKKLVAIIPRSNTTETIIKCTSIDTLIEATTSYIKYYEQSKTKTIKFDNKTYIIYNGKAINGDITDYISADTFRGTIKYINNSNDIDCIIIDEYYNAIVQSYDENKKIIYDRITGKSIALDGVDYCIYKDKRLVSIDQLNTNDVLTVYSTNDGNGLIRIFVYENNNFVDMVSATDSGSVTINGDTYGIGLEMDTKLYAGLYGKFYYNQNNEIVFFDSESKFSGIGYFIKAYQGDDGVDCYIRIKTSANEVISYKCSQRLIIDGITYRDSERICKYFANVMQCSPVIYKINSDYEIRMIDTYLKGTEDVNDKLTALTSEVTNYYYRPETRMLIISGRGVTPVSDDALLLSMYNQAEVDENSFDHVSGNLFYDSEPTGIAYSTTGENQADIFMWTDRISKELYGRNVIIVSDIFETVADDEAEVAIKGYNKSENETYILSKIGKKDSSNNKIMQNVSIGDVLDICVDGENKIDKMRVLAYADGSAKKGDIDSLINESNPYSGDNNQTLRYTMGTVEKTKDNYIIITNPNEANEYIYTSSATSYKLYDGSKGKNVIPISSQNILTGDRAVAWIVDGVPKSIFVY